MDEGIKKLIKAGFAAWRKQVDFVRELFEASHIPEARILTVVYLDGFSNWLHPESRRLGWNFTRTLMQYGGAPVFSLILPDLIIKNHGQGLKRNPTFDMIATFIINLPLHETYTVDEFSALAEIHLSEPALTKLKSIMYKGAIAYEVYGELRSPNVHRLGSFAGFIFGDHIHHGEPLQIVNFEMLYAALQRIFDHAEKSALELGRTLGPPEIG
jgi:hypothetical protein